MNVVYATTTASVATPEGTSVTVRAGTHWPANDPVVLAQPSLFSTDARYGISFSTLPRELAEEAPVEQATANPGELRTTRRRNV
jgi:hypothetical protein